MLNKVYCFIVFLFIIACSGSDDVKLESKTVSLIVDGAFDDKGFNESSSKAIRKLKTDFNINIIEKASTGNSHLGDIATLEDGNSNLIWGIGFRLSDVLLQRASENISINYAIMEGVYNEIQMPKNLLNISFRSEEVAFLAGYFASKTSKTGKIGFIGGVKGKVLESFMYGYEAGAKYANSTIKVISQYVGTFGDFGLGRSTASNMYRDGVDIVFAAAGLSGIGVIEAAKELGPDHYIIGVDQDQSYLAPNNVLVSAVKKVDSLMYSLTKKYLETGIWDGGKNIFFGLKEDGLGLVLNENLKSNYSEIYNKSLEIGQSIMEGIIKVPYDKASYDNFVLQIAN
ncbi:MULTISPECIES: nucleoside ABC transporter substrate-binding protein BmpD [Borreliella]|uniref:BMP family ABC transporter substrate-binding protein n=2 Tax=Borreliella TaxID=64895 RepID=A0A7I6GW73_BORGP|nr:nucleoside ABC transporter substrate-binding protein BmpD [Borreliella bavariensis]AAU07238.1 basic membrane protein D [Borreliella bavariensis PBi]AZA26747.1 BMP family ABC transporter substrate-binding protein [Borreliella bavariensis PBi]WLN24051.1 nucleoside ABC transporter substrate-binding protein BmpD [Borreliella bavariensis]